MNRKKIITVTAAAFILLVAVIGTTFAWFTARSSSSVPITMGEMKIVASFDDINIKVYEPGNVVTAQGTIKNTGSIPAVIHIESGTQISFVYADDDLTLWSGDEWVDDTEGAISVLFDQNDALKFDDKGDIVWGWFYNLSDPGDRYLLLVAGAEINVSLTYKCSGSIMTNKYMNAIIRTTNDLDATQTYDEAMLELFGLGFGDLGMVINLEGSNGRVGTVPEYVMNQIREIFHQ